VKTIMMICPQSLSCWQPIETSIVDMANDKAPGASGVNANALNNLSENVVKTLHQILVNAYKGMDDQKEWHIANLKSLFKKGDPSDPSNWQGICLKDMTARIMIATLNKERLLKILAKHGVETQYGSQKARVCLMPSAKGVDAMVKMSFF
jgi:hypothetical protein